jgi:hypothetical protein
MAPEEIDMEEHRTDGFTLVRTLGSPGLDLHVPAVELEPELEALIQTERRTSQEPFEGPDRRRGAWFGWAPDHQAAEEKITEEKRIKLHHSPPASPGSPGRALSGNSPGHRTQEMSTTTEIRQTPDPAAAYAHFELAQELEKSGHLDQALRAYQTAGAPLSIRRIRSKLHQIHPRRRH